MLPQEKSSEPPYLSQTINSVIGISKDPSKGPGALRLLVAASSALSRIDNCDFSITRGFKRLHWVAFLNIRKENSIQFKERSKNSKSKTSTTKLDLRPSAGLSENLTIGPSEVTSQDAYIFSVFITRRP